MHSCLERARLRLRLIGHVGFYYSAISVALTCVFIQASNPRYFALASTDPLGDTAVTLSLCPSTIADLGWSLHTHPAICTAYIARIHPAPSCTGVV